MLTVALSERGRPVTLKSIEFGKCFVFDDDQSREKGAIYMKGVEGMHTSLSVAPGYRLCVQLNTGEIKIFHGTRVITEVKQTVSAEFEL